MSPNEQSVKSGLWYKLKATFSNLTRHMVRQTNTQQGWSPLQERVEQQKDEPTFQHMALLSGEIQKLEELKSELLAKEGAKALSFSDRYIDPSIARLEGLLGHFYSSPLKKETQKDLLKKINLLKRENTFTKLKTEIIEREQKALFDDITYLAGYQGEQSKAHSSEINKIASILLDLSKHTPIQGNLLALFRWKHTVDLLRQNLLDLAIEKINQTKTTDKASSIEQIMKKLSQDRVYPLASLLSHSPTIEENTSSNALLDSLRSNIDLFMTHLID